jgi:hypothetical protein
MREVVLLCQPAGMVVGQLTLEAERELIPGLIVRFSAPERHPLRLAIGTGLQRLEPLGAVVFGHEPQRLGHPVLTRAKPSPSA